MYRKRNVSVVEAELEYIREEIKKVHKTLEKLEGKEMYLQSELIFNKKRIDEEKAL